MLSCFKVFPLLFALVCIVSVFAITQTQLSAAGSPKAIKVFDVDKYGAVGDGKSDSGPGIRRAIADAIRYGAPAEVLLGAGRYRVGGASGEKAALAILKAKDLVLRGAGTKTELIITNPETGGISVSDSENVIVKDLALDYDPVPFTQGRVIAIDQANSTFDFRLDSGFPLLSEEWFMRAPAKWGMIFDPQKPILKPGAPDFVYLDSWSKLDDSTWQVKLTGSDSGKIRAFAVGDRFVQIARSVGSHGVVFWNSKNVTLQNVTIYASLAAATVFGLNDGFAVKGLSVRIRPKSSRLISTNADGIHCPMNRSRVLIEKCFFEGMADDAINLYTPPALVKKVVSPYELLVSNGSNIRKGDDLQMFNPRTGRVLGKVKAAETSPSEGNTLLKMCVAVDGITAGTDHRDSDSVYDLSSCGQEYIIRKNRFGKHRGRQILLRAGKGIIRDNILEASGSCGIAIYNEPDYPEGPVPSDILITGNKFTGNPSYPNGAAMQITPMSIGYKLAEGRGIHNIEVKNNTFTNVGIMYIAGVSGIKFTKNTIQADANDKHKIGSGLITFEDCDGIVIDELSVADSRPGAKPAVEVRALVDPGSKGFSIHNLKTKGARVLDKRVAGKQ